MEHLRNFGFLIKDVSRLYVRHFEQCATRLGMTLPQCKVLIYLTRNQGTTQARLAELSETDPMTLVRILDRMEKDAWLERRPDPRDRRAHRLFVKPASDPIVAEILRIGDSARSQVLSGLSTEDQSRLMDLLERLHGNLVALVPNAVDPSREVLRSTPLEPKNRLPAPRRARGSHARRRKASR